MGASPTPVDSLNYVSDNGHRIFSSNTFDVTGDFSFTALDVQFTVAHPLVAAPRTYDPVDSTVARSFLSIHSVSALAGDSFVMSIEPTTGTGFCFGDGTVTGCPCGNDGAPGHGCQNSATPGARLTAIGTTSPDTIVLGASGEKPSALTVFLQGTQAISPVPFGDGLRCVHGVLKRLYTKHAWAGAVSAPQGGDLSITARSAQLNHPIAPGSTRYYMTYYRDGILGFCPSPMGSTFNSSNAWTILW
jgi:hypothetical protein